MCIGVREPAIRVLLGRLLRAGLAAADDRLVTGPTGTNVNDLDDLYVMIVE